MFGISGLLASVAMMMPAMDSFYSLPLRFIDDGPLIIRRHRLEVAMDSHHFDCAGCGKRFSREVLLDGVVSKCTARARDLVPEPFLHL